MCNLNISLSFSTYTISSFVMTNAQMTFTL